MLCLSSDRVSSVASASIWSKKVLRSRSLPGPSLLALDAASGALDTGPGWRQDHIHGAFPFPFSFSPSINIVFGLQWRYYHLQASFAAYILAAKGPQDSSATPALDCFTAPSGGTCVETSSTKVQNHTSLRRRGSSLTELLLFVFTCFLNPTTNLVFFFKFFFIPSLPCPIMPDD